MKKVLLFSIIASFLIYTQGCRQDKDEIIPIGSVKLPKDSVATLPIVKDTVWEKESTLVGKKLKIDTLFDILKSPDISRTVNPSVANILRLPDGTKIDLPKGFCTTLDNKPVTEGIKVEVKVLKNKGEFLLEDRPTISNGRLLISGGVVFISANANGAALKVADGKSVRIAVPGNNPDAQMTFFEGQPNSSNPLQFNWVQPTNSEAQRLNAQVRIDTQDVRNALDSVVGYNIFTDRFGWINIDKFSGQANLTKELCVSLPDTFTNKNTKVFIVFKDLLSVAKLSGSPELKQFCIPSVYQGIPIGSKVALVSVSYLSDKVYFATQDLTVAATNSINLKPQIISAEDLKTALSKL